MEVEKFSAAYGAVAAAVGATTAVACCLLGILYGATYV
jgi:hypothetical protein